MIIKTVQFFIQQGILCMKINKKYSNLMQQKCKPYYELDDYRIIIFKMGKRKVPIFYVPLYGGSKK